MATKEYSLVEWSTQKLFEAVERGQTKNIIAFLNRGAEINAKDKDGKSPFMKAAQKRNYVIQKLLLSMGAQINAVDKDDFTALHYDSAHGDVESIKLLLANGAKVNSRNKDGRTPLHFAVKEGKVDAVDMLVYCGADSLIKDTNGLSPISICTEPSMKNHLIRAQEIMLAIKHDYIHMQQCVLKPGEEVYLKNVGLTLITPKEFDNSGINFLCRRLRPEYANHDIGAGEKELLMSDTFDYRFSSSFSNVKVKFRIPMYTFPEPYEELYLKTNEIPKIIQDVHKPINNYKRDANGKNGICEVEMEFAKTNVFVLVTRPKIEHFKMTSEGDVLISEVDNYIQIDVPKDSFTEEGYITLELIPRAPYREKEFEQVLSLTNFYDINHTAAEQPQKNVSITVPTPKDHDEDEDEFFILRRTERDSHRELLNWQIIARNPNTNDGKITFETHHFSTFVGMGYSTIETYTSEQTQIKFHEKNEHKSTSVGDIVSEKKIIKACASLYEKAKRRECYVTFISMLRRKEDKDTEFEILVDCVKTTNMLTTIQKWSTEAFIDQKPSYPKPESEFVTFPKKMFNFKIGGNAKTCNEIQNKLQYHPHRKENNFMMFDIVLKDDSQEEIAWVEINKMKDNTEEKMTLGTVTVHLRGKRRLGKDAEGNADPHFKGFTDDRFVGLLAEQLGDEWTIIGIYLGLSGQEIRRISIKDQNQKKKVKMLRRWRDNTRDRPDYGVRFLATALKRSGRQDLVEFLQSEMSAWIDDPDHQKFVPEFCNWAKRSLSEEWTSSEGPLEPMTDSFLMALVDKLGKRFELGPELGVTLAKMNDIEEDQFCRNPQIQMLELLISSRETHQQRHEAFVKLDLALERFDFTEQRLWMFTAVDEWAGDDMNPEMTSMKNYVKSARLMLEKCVTEDKGDDIKEIPVKLNSELREVKDEHLKENSEKIQPEINEVKEDLIEHLKEENSEEIQPEIHEVKEDLFEHQKEENSEKIQPEIHEVKEDLIEHLKEENSEKIQPEIHEVKEDLIEHLKEENSEKIQPEIHEVKEDLIEHLKEENSEKIQPEIHEVKEDRDEHLKQENSEKL